MPTTSMPRVDSTPERASQHNAKSLCAVGRRIGTAHRGSIRLAPAANCSPLSRPHNLHWIGVGNGCRRPLPPNPVCSSPATGSPVSCFLIGIGALIGGRRTS